VNWQIYHRKKVN